MEEEEQESRQQQKPLLWKSEPQPESIVSVTLARSITSVLDSRPKKLIDAITVTSLSQQPPSSSSSLQHSLSFLHKYVTDAAHCRNHNSLHQLLIPIIQNSLKWKDSKHGGGQGMILLSWLFQDELLFEPVAEALAGVIVAKEDRYLLLGWCVFVRSLVEYENSVHQSMLRGIRGRYGDLLRILSTRLRDLAGIASKGRMVLSCHLALGYLLLIVF